MIIPQSELYARARKRTQTVKSIQPVLILLYVCLSGADAGGPYNTLDDFLDQTETQTEANLRKYVRDGQGKGIDGEFI